MKRFSTIILSILLAVIMCSLSCVQVFADSTTYIKELKIEYGETLDEAKAALEEKGYTPIDGDFNRGGKQAVAVGYIATDKRSEAITDVRAMEENCGYSFEEYEQVLEQKKAQVSNIFNELLAAIEEFRDNYNSGESAQAEYAYKMMNYYTNDDMQITDEETGKERDMGVGEMLLSDDTTDEQIKTLLLEGNNKVIAGIEEYLSIACSTSDWVSEASDCEEYTGNTLSATLSNNAKNIYNTLSDFQKEVKLYETLPVDSSSSEEEVEAFINDENTTDAQEQAYTHISQIYDTIKNTSYLDSTLYDVFMSDLNSFNNKKVAPLVELMTKGQIAAFGYVPLWQSIAISGMTDDDWTAAIEEQEEKCAVEGLAQVSAFSEVDRSIFSPEGIALTSAALRKKDSSNEVELGTSDSGKKIKTILYSCLGVGIVVCAVGILLKANSGEFGAMIVNHMLEAMPAEEYSVGLQSQMLTQQTAKIGSIGTWAISIGALIISIVVLVNFFVDSDSPEHPKYSQMPRVLVDATDMDDGTTEYTNYYCTADLSNSLADLNGWNGKHWIGLYYTKDTKAGEPLTTEYLFNYGSATIETSDSVTWKPVANFGEAAAKNLNNNGLWDGNIKEADHVYLYFMEATAAAATTSSVFSTGTVAAISAFCGLVVGAVITAVIAKSKAKKSKAPATATSN